MWAVCNRCKKVKDHFCFSKDRSRKNGLQSRCKDCLSILRKQWPSTDPARTKKWREANPERVRMSKNKWREANPEYAKDYNRVRYDREHGHSSTRDWYRNNNESLRAAKELAGIDDSIFNETSMDIVENLITSLRKS